MCIVPAGVHNWDPGSIFFVLDEFSAGVGEVSLFFYGEGVHVCAEQDRGTGAVVEDSGEAVAADVRVEFIVLEGLEVGGCQVGGLGFATRQFGVLVDGAVDGFEGG
jgi:hypothetical protein